MANIKRGGESTGVHRRKTQRREVPERGHEKKGGRVKLERGCEKDAAITTPDLFIGNQMKDRALIRGNQGLSDY